MQFSLSLGTSKTSLVSRPKTACLGSRTDLTFGIDKSEPSLFLSRQRYGVNFRKVPPAIVSGYHRLTVSMITSLC